ncbi:MAG: hypothetical protein SGI77_14685 [Pirellulaceae bacterium]|nr:hypothetical protein [Pirellulaceae bacterium]
MPVEYQIDSIHDGGEGNRMLPIKNLIAFSFCFLLHVPISSSIFGEGNAKAKSIRERVSWQEELAFRKSDGLTEALDRGYALIEKGAKNYPSNRQCFSCHHQTLPLLAESLNRRHYSDNFSVHREPPTDFWQHELTRSILEFTEESFSGKRESMREGKGVGGQALTVAYGLWAMDLAGAKHNATIDAMLEYLLQTQAEDGAWNFQSLRPPAASSRSMTTAIAVYGLRAYGVDCAETKRLREVFMKAREWSRHADETDSLEELNGLIWLDYMLEKEHARELLAPANETTNSPDLFSKGAEDLRDNDRLRMRTEKLWSQQRGDGGWGQTPEMASDAYATGQSLLILAQVSYYDKTSVYREREFIKGIKFLLGTQESDGSWHVATRAKPVQVFFDNGDPHGKDQFISMMATTWSVAALASFRESRFDPIESYQVLDRERKQRKISIESSSDPFER